MRTAIILLLATQLLHASDVLDSLPGPVKIMLNRAPENNRQGVREYLTAAGVFNPDSNRGLAVHLHGQLEKNTCFNELAGMFYADINILDVLTQGNGFSFDNALEDEPHISYNLDKVKLPVKKGWLWKLAMKYSRGDPNIAMELIGTCGHDDTRQLHTGFLQFKGVKATSLSFQEQVVRKYRPSFPNSAVTLRSGSATLGTESKILTQCPGRDSLIFTPGSLGAGVDIDEQTKNQVASIQSPDLGAVAQPAKYYHTIASAYMSCLLARRGVPNFVTRLIQRKVILNYRSSKLCQNIGRILKHHEGALKQFGEQKKYKSFESYLSDQAKKIAKFNHQERSSFCKLGNGAQKPICSFLWRFTWPGVQKRLKGSSLTINDLITRILGEADAAVLFSKSGDYNPNKCTSTKFLPTIGDWMRLYGNPNRRPCPDLSRRRCLAAKQVMRTWHADFTLSKAQHGVGSQFANRVCEEVPYKKDPLEKSCEILSSIKSDTSVQTNRSEAKR